MKVKNIYHRLRVSYLIKIQMYELYSINTVRDS